MSYDVPTTNILLFFEAGTEIDVARLDQLTRQLRTEIQELDVEAVDLVRSQSVPEGAKSGEAITLGALAVTLVPAALPQLLEFVQAWALRRANRVVKIKTQSKDELIEVEFDPRTISQDQLKSFVDTLLTSLEKQKKQD